MTNDFNKALNEFINDLSSHGAGVISVRETKSTTRKYIPIDGDRSVYCFVDAANGDIYKAENYKKPAMGKRGNIFEPDTYIRNRAYYQFGRWLYREYNK